MPPHFENATNLPLRLFFMHTLSQASIPQGFGEKSYTKEYTPGPEKENKSDKNLIINSVQNYLTYFVSVKNKIFSMVKV